MPPSSPQRASRAQERIALEERPKARRGDAAPQSRRCVPILSTLRDYRLTACSDSRADLWSNSHTGQDFAAPTGTPDPGGSRRRDRRGRLGWPLRLAVIVQHKDGSETWYCHMSGFVRRSGKVKAGTVIGKVGSTGNTTGPHLHLEVRINNEPVNPRSWLRKRGIEI